jgi:hypothetical protein
MNDQQPSPGKSLINEVERLREAVLLLCELQKELAKKVDAALPVPITEEVLNPITKSGS